MHDWELYHVAFPSAVASLNSSALGWFSREGEIDVTSEDFGPSQ